MTMAGNTIGKLFTVTTAGESHGAGLVAIVDGVPPGMSLSEADLQSDLDRRKPGTSKFLYNVVKMTKSRLSLACLKAKPPVRQLRY